MPLCNAKKTPLRRPVSGGLYALALLGSLTLLTSCSDSWPEALDPSDWYASTVGEEAAPTSDEPVPGADEDYPNLAEVPEAPTNVSSPEQIDQVAQTLAADLANAQYSTDLQRADDETAPEPMPIAQPEVVEVETETTYIEPGGEIEIAEAEAVAIVEPEAEVVAEEMAEEEIAAEAVAAESQALAVAGMEQPELEPMDVAVVPVTESRVETETIRGEDGELVGTVTRVVVATEVVDVPVDAPVVEEAVAVLETPAMESEVVVTAPEPVAPEPELMVAEPELMVVEPEATVEAMAVTEEVVTEEVEPVAVVASPPAEEVVVAPAEAVVVETAAVSEAPAQGLSLVAQSERTDDTIDVVELPAQVVVVPEYAAELAMAEVEAVAEAPAASDVAAATQAAATDVEAVAMAVAMEDSAAEAEGMALASGQIVPGETRIEQQTVVDNGTGDLIGSVTRTVEVVKVVQQVPGTPPVEEVVVVEEPAMTFTEVAETLEPVAEPAVAPAAAEVASATVVQTTGVTTSVETLDFADLFAASGPGAGTQEQPLVIASADTQAAAQAAFTTVGLPAPETLAAIIRFGDGSSALGAVERDIVRQLAAIHAERGGTIRLVGHASRAAGGMETSSQELVNFNISLDRATAVAAELIRQGVPSSVVVVEAAGDSQASADAAQDRRVDVLFGA